MTVDIKYTDEEKLLNSYHAAGKEMQLDYENLKREIIERGDIIETREIGGKLSHLVSPKVYTIIERNKKGDPIRWRFHKYLNEDELAMLANQLNENN